MRLLLDMAGEWTGALEYLDYGSGERARIPIRASVRATPDRAFVIRDLVFTDPGVEVHAKEIVTIDPQSGQLVIAFFRDRVAEMSRFDVVESEVDGPGTWSIVLENDGADAGRPARIRVEQTLRDGELRSVKKVRFLDGAQDDEQDGEQAGEAGGWLVRNETRLQRAAPDPQSLVGRWRVDLRPTPDAEPYFQEMVIEAVEEGTLRGRFYGASVSEARINGDWGAVRFAFVTEDGSGPYFTTGVLRGERLEGTTHSAGRDFLSCWTAERVE